MENKKVEIKDYEKEQHELLIALNMVGIKIDYITTDLIYRVLEVLNNKKGKMDINDTSKIQHEHAIYWQTYFSYLDKQEQVEKENSENQKKLLLVVR